MHGRAQGNERDYKRLQLIRLKWTRSCSRYRIASATPACMGVMAWRACLTHSLRLSLRRQMKCNRNCFTNSPQCITLRQMSWSLISEETSTWISWEMRTWCNNCCLTCTVSNTWTIRGGLYTRIPCYLELAFRQTRQTLTHTPISPSHPWADEKRVKKDNGWKLN